MLAVNLLIPLSSPEFRIVENTSMPNEMAT